MKVVGYADPLSVRAGEPVVAHISCREPDYRLEVVRLLHGDPDPQGPGLQTVPCGTPIAGSYQGMDHPLPVGSWVSGPGISLDGARGLSLATWIWPTAPSLGRWQSILGFWAGEGRSVSIGLDGRGRLAFLWDGTVRLRLTTPMSARRWAFVAVTLDPDAASATLFCAVRAARHRRSQFVHVESAHSDSFVARGVVAAAARPLGTADAVEHYNGKLSRPSVYREPLPLVDLQELAAGRESDARPALAWRLWPTAGEEAHDESGSGWHGHLVNLPERAVTSWNWTGDAIDPGLRPSEYDAAWFHDDDLEDAKWPPAAELHVPEHWQPGIYAFRVEASDFVEHVPFVVTAPCSGERPRVALLLPVFSWLAYAQDHAFLRPDTLARLGGLEKVVAEGSAYEQAAFSYILEKRLCGLYDLHTDGSGVHASSWRRPIPNMRPGYRKASSRFQLTHQLAGDLYLVHWLEQVGCAYDVITDVDLQARGELALEPYGAVITGTHPEYWTGRMLTGMESWLDEGGRLMYLGGNGFYWVTSIDEQRPWVIEVRRRDIPGATAAPLPGEGIAALTGEPGGLWSQRGRPPDALVGVTTCGIGLDVAVPFRRTAASYDQRVSFAFEGIGDEPIGDAGLHLGAAGGWEIDRTGPETPAHALVVAEAAPPAGAYQVVMDQALSMTLTDRPGHATAQMTFFETPAGGAVLSVGSISFSACLSHNDYDNPVARLARNVLHRFADPTAFTVPIEEEEIA